MKKHKPLRLLVTTYVRATHGRCLEKKAKTPREKITDFFEDLENRGPITFKGQTLFEKWTKKIRTDMEKKRIWIRNPKVDEFEFIVEYILRLQKGYHKDYKEDDSVNKDHFVQRFDSKVIFSKRLESFRQIYLAIRVWGLRTKTFYLKRWLKRDSWASHYYETFVRPIDFVEKYHAKKPTFKYVVTVYRNVKTEKKEYFSETKT